MPSIFISYRREDSMAHAGRLHDRLSSHFGKSAVFMDIEAIRPGVDFTDLLQKSVGTCDVLLAIIGRNWLKVEDEDGRNRLASPEDFVRVEIGTALTAGIYVIPVLVGGARMPRANELPAELSQLARRQAQDLPDTSFHAAVTQLINTIEAAEEEKRQAREIEAQKAQRKTSQSSTNDVRAPELNLQSSGIASHDTPATIISEDSSPVLDELAPIVHSPAADAIEMAHVLSIDLVGYSRLNMEDQRDQLTALQQLVRKTGAASVASRTNNLSSLLTGDGMALVFFGDPASPIRCALEIVPALAAYPALKLRMGINTGPVYRTADVNANLNANGGGINFAQRIMDAGDAGHILLSKNTADILSQFSEWSAHIHDLGEHAVKPDVRLRFYNFYTETEGNPAVPSRFLAERKNVVRRWRVGLVLAAALAAAVLIGFQANRMGLVPARHHRRSVAVLGFNNLTGPEAHWISTVLADGIRARLAENGKVKTIPGQEVSDMNRDLGITSFVSLGKATLARVRRYGAELVVLGSYTDINGRVALNLELQDTDQQETFDSLQESGQESDLTSLVERVGSRLRGKLGMGELSPDKERQLALAQPQPEAAPFYADGLASLRLYDAVNAKTLLSKAALADPNFPLAHHFLASAWHMLGYDARARDEADTAYKLAGKLAMEDQLVIKGNLAELSHDWPKAIAAYDQLYGYAPDRLDYALALARVKRLSGQLKPALDGLAALQQPHNLQSADPRIDLEKAEAAAAFGDYGMARNAADRAVAAARELGARMLESRALFWKCAALRNERKLDAAQAACESAAEQAQSIGDRLGTARSLTGLANCLREKGDLANAAKKLEQAVRITEAIGTKLDESGALSNLAIVLMKQGNLTDAEATYRRAFAIQEEIGVKSEQAKTANNLCGVLITQGKLPEAQVTCKKAVDLATAVGNKRSLALALGQLASIQQERGNLSEATALRAKVRELNVDSPK